MTDLPSMVCVPYGGDGFALPPSWKKFFSRHLTDALLLFFLLAFGVFTSFPSAAHANAAPDPDRHAKLVALEVAAMQNATAPQKHLSLTPAPRAQVRVPITAYTSEVGETDASPFITASGTRVRDGIVAANFLPIGTKVKIPQLFGDKVFTVEDRMNKRYGAAMDIWMNDRMSARKFGRKHADVVVLDEK
jgi:3D (Asp-Asp-Asp) domain-containing protein